MKNYLPILGIFGFLFLFSCLKDKTQAPTVQPVDICSTTVSYTSDIVPILNSSCKNQGGGGGCHEVWVDSYAQLKSRIDNNTFQTRVLDLKNMPQMPNSAGVDSLSQDELQTLECWIDQGYPEN